MSWDDYTLYAFSAKDNPYLDMLREFLEGIPETPYQQRPRRAANPNWASLKDGPEAGKKYMR